MLRLLGTRNTEFAERALSATVMRVVDLELAAALTAQCLDLGVGSAHAVHGGLKAAGVCVSEFLRHHSICRVAPTIRAIRTARIPTRLRRATAGVVLAKLDPIRVRFRAVAAFAAVLEDLLVGALPICEGMRATCSRRKRNRHLCVGRISGAGGGGASLRLGVSSNARVLRAELVRSVGAAAVHAGAASLRLGVRRVARVVRAELVPSVVAAAELSSAASLHLGVRLLACVGRAELVRSVERAAAERAVAASLGFGVCHDASVLLALLGRQVGAAAVLASAGRAGRGRRCGLTRCGRRCDLKLALLCTSVCNKTSTRRHSGLVQ